MRAIKQDNRHYLAAMPRSLMDAPQEKTDSITAFVAQKIVTMDPSWPQGTVVTIKDGRSLSVGSLDDLEPWLKRFPYTIDDTSTDTVISPGLVEAHRYSVLDPSTSAARP